ncbi:MAG TPA: amino acid permease [Gemmatimonadaceae bacterium]|nr:amino acid permease [Gemmatimonadaceae bacterium]
MSGGLRRVIELRHATAMVVGTIVGAAIFVQPSEVTSQVPSAAGVLGVWLVAGLLTLVGSLVSAELSSIYTRSGGVYVYLAKSLHPGVGFMWGWAMLLTMHSGIIAAIATVFARYAGQLFPLGALGQRLVAVGAIVVLSAINYGGVRAGSRLQAWFTAGKLLAVAAIVVAGIVAGGGRGGNSWSLSLGGAGWADFLLAVAAGLFAYGGWHMVTYSAEETVDPRRTIPRALVVGTLVVTFVYMAVNAVYLWVLPVEVVTGSSRVAAELADSLLGRGGATAMAAIVMFSSFGALAGIVLAGPRVYYAMAQDGLLFRWLGDVHPRFGTPHRAIVLQALWSSVLAATGSFRALFTRVVYTEWIFFGSMALGLLLLGWRGVRGTTFRIPLFPWTPLLFATAAFLVAGNAVLSSPLDSAVGLGIVLSGWPLYHWWHKRRLGRAL